MTTARAGGERCSARRSSLAPIKGKVRRDRGRSCGELELGARSTARRAKGPSDGALEQSVQICTSASMRESREDWGVWVVKRCRRRRKDRPGLRVRPAGALETEAALRWLMMRMAWGKARSRKSAEVRDSADAAAAAGSALPFSSPSSTPARARWQPTPTATSAAAAAPAPAPPQPRSRSAGANRPTQLRRSPRCSPCRA